MYVSHLAPLPVRSAGTIQAQMLHAQLSPHNDVKGLDARCVSNVIWAVVKLDLASDPGCLGTELILSISPLVAKLLPQSSPQVCARPRAHARADGGGL